MLLGGRRFGRTQRGNNNAYCQDNDLSWYHWSLPELDADLQEFVRRLIRIRAEQPVLRRRRFLHGSRLRAIDAKDIAWLHPGGGEMTAADCTTPSCMRSAWCSTATPSKNQVHARNGCR
jgi:glycogen operon protein